MDEQPEVKRTVHPLIKIGIITHLVLMLSWSLPPAPGALANGTIKPSLLEVVSHPGDWLLWANSKFRHKSPTSSYVMWSGTWQYWDMFAPNPASTDIYLDAYVEYKDGTHKTIPYPRMYSLPIYKKYFMERFRKYVERLSPDQYSAKWPQFAHWMAGQAWTDPDNPPVHIRLRRNWMDVQPMGTPQQTEYYHYEFYETDLDQAWLKRDKRW